MAPAHGVNKCSLCTQLIPANRDLIDTHMRQQHGVVVYQKAPLSREAREAIVDRLEAKVGRRHFIIPEGLPGIGKKNCNKCGWTDKPGFWLANGTGICETCVKLAAGTLSIEEEINYRD